MINCHLYSLFSDNGDDSASDSDNNTTTFKSNNQRGKEKVYDLKKYHFQRNLWSTTVII